MWRRRTKPREAGESGTSLIEMAFAGPILMLILLGTLDLGQVFFDYIHLRSATIEGATYGARNPTDTSGITTAVNDSGVPAGTDVTVTTTGSCGTVGGSGFIEVQATSVFHPVTMSFFDRFGLSTWNLRSTTTMRCQT